MRNKLGLAVEATPEEFVHNSAQNKFTVLMILDKLYSIFKNHALIGKLIFEKKKILNPRPVILSLIYKF